MAAPLSPIADTLDRLIWSRLSRFWSRDYNPDDKEKLNAVYEGCMEALDAEFARLFEINSAKSVDSARPLMQRRWLRLDLNRHAELAAFMKFLSTSSTGGAASNDASNVLSCNNDVNNHARHWHITFPYTVPLGDPVTRATIELYYPIDIRLVEIYHMVRDLRTGIARGVRLRPGADYGLSTTGTGIRLSATVPTDQYEISIGFDLSGSRYDGLRPLVAYGAGYDVVSTNAVRIDPELGIANLPVHVMVVKNVRDSGSGSLIETNTPTFNSSYIFIPWTGTSTGAQHGADPGVIVLPNTVAIEATDAVFVFGLARGDFEENHRHILATTVLNPGAAPRIATTLFRAAGSTSIVEFDESMRPGVFGSIAYLGQPFEVFIDGLLLPRTDYSYGDDGRLHLRQPLSWTTDQYRSVVIRTTDEFRTLHGGNNAQHIHIECLLQGARPPEFYETFDDGGDFDDEQGGVFDDKRALNVVFLDDISADLNTLEVWVNGVRRYSEIDYVASFDDDTKRVRLSFTFNIKDSSIYCSYRRESRTFVYGRFAKGFIGETLSGLLTDMRSLTDAFTGSTGFQIKNISRLVEAAQTAAAGGNPLLTLFYDERQEYNDISVDSDRVALSLDDARLVESMGLKLVNIPFLTDRVLRPGMRLEAGLDYDVVDGEIRSSFDLTAKRYENDAHPGVWWCPIVIIDDQMLRKNFGTLVGDEREDSSEEYRTALQANLTLRFEGPVVQSLERTAATLYGSPVFSQDGRVTAINKRVIAYDISVSNGSTTQIARVPANFAKPIVGEAILRSQSLAKPAVLNARLTGLISHQLSSIIAEMPYFQGVEGDIVHLTTFDPVYPTTPIPFVTTLRSMLYDSNYVPARVTLSLVKAPRFDVTIDSEIRILRDGGPPYAGIDGFVASVDEISETVMTTTGGEYILPPGRVAEQRVGEYIERGQPLFQSYAKLYDDNRRPEWHWLTPQHYSRDWQYILKGQGTPAKTNEAKDSRYATVYPPIEDGDYSTITLDPVTPIVKRGVTIELVDDRTQEIYRFTVVGLNGADVYISPVVTSEISGIVTVTDNTVSNKEYFGLATPPTSAPIQSALAFPQPIRARVLQLLDTTGFPPSGQCVVRLPNGGSTEVTYNRVAPGFILDCEWPASFPALTGPSPGIGIPGPLTAQLPQEAIVRVVSEHRQTRLNPAFLALVNLRVTKDLRTSETRIAVTDQNADDLYGYLKNTSAVIESAAITRPQVLRDLMHDVVPPGSTLVVVSKHRIIDVYSGGIGEK